MLKKVHMELIFCMSKREAKKILTNLIDKKGVL